MDLYFYGGSIDCKIRHWRMEDAESLATALYNKKMHYETEKRKFAKKWKQLRKEYAAAEMEQQAIQIMYQYDWEDFKKNVFIVSIIKICRSRFWIMKQEW